MSIRMAFGPMPDDTGSPAGLTLRRKNSGEVLLTMMTGDDDEVNELLHTLVLMLELDDGIITALLAHQSELFTDRGANLTALLAARRGGFSNPPMPQL